MSPFPVSFMRAVFHTRMAVHALVLVFSVSLPTRSRAAASAPRVAESGESPAWNLRSESMSVQLGPDGALTLHSLPSGAQWTSVVPAAPVVRVQSASESADGRSLLARLSIDGKSWELSLALARTRPILEVELLASSDRRMEGDLCYPFAIGAPGGGWLAVVPQKSGLLLGTSDAAEPDVLGNYYTYEGPGLSMPWYGLTDLQSGMMTILETPDDSGMSLRLTREGPDARFCVGPLWRPSMGTVRYPRRLQIRLVTGGYVAMAKAYREHLVRRGEFKTLRQKAAECPLVAKLMGALDVHLRGDDSDLRSMVTDLETQGASHLLVNTGASEDTLAWMRTRGCLVGTYRIYTDIHPPGDLQAGAIFSRGYPDDAYTQADGRPVPGFAYSPNHRTTYRSSIMQLPLMAELLPPLLHVRGYEAVFLDVTTSTRLTEDYSPRHYLDRTADREERRALLRFAADQGVVVGSEDGNSWAAQDVDYFEGMTMPRRFLHMPGIGIRNYTMKFAPNQKYRDFILNEKVRVPLWDLVFHDSVVSTWRWDFTPNRYLSTRDWERQNLIQITQGDMPILVLNPAILASCREWIERTCREVCSWNGKVGWDELVDHRALTADRTVQESRFSSGWEVVVNFSDTVPFAFPDGSEVAPCSFTIRRTADGRGAQDPEGAKK